MTADEFFEESLKELTAFRDAWKAASAVNDEAFPADMPAGEWYENFIQQNQSGFPDNLEDLKKEWMAIAKETKENP